MQIFSKGGERSLKVAHSFFFMIYFLVLVLLFAQTERVSVSNMQNAVDVDFFFFGGGVVICENLFVSQFKSGNWQSQQQKQAQIPHFFFLGNICWECLGSLNVQKMCQKVGILVRIKRFGVFRMRDFKLLFCMQLYRQPRRMTRALYSFLSLNLMGSPVGSKTQIRLSLIMASFPDHQT